MIESVAVTNYRGETLVMDLMNPYSSGFAITKITGLGPSKANINTTEVSTNDGSIFNMSRLTARNIVINLDFVGINIEELRQKSYKYFPIKKNLTLTIKTTNREAIIDGYVESNEPDVFSKGENTKISIVCPDPYFYSTSHSESNGVVFSGIEPVFEFPFSNEDVDMPRLEFSIQNEFTEALIKYDGDSEVGMTINIHALGEVGDISIYNILTREVLKIRASVIEEVTGQVIKSGDNIIICTVKGKKSVRLLRDSVYTNVINALDRDSDWPQLSKGDNVLAYTAKFGIENLQVRITNDTIYEGV